MLRAMARLYLALDLTLLHTPADTECGATLRGSLGGLCGRLADDALYGNPPYLSSLFPNKNETVPVPRGTEANVTASKSFLCVAGLLYRE